MTVTVTLSTYTVHILYCAYVLCSCVPGILYVFDSLRSDLQRAGRQVRIGDLYSLQMLVDKY